ncbi:xylose isomerase-like protein [Pisolithus tinctorius]|uniref:Uncharacterized protein n=1 Tax=Pisolithus tinctorius Marx 270 TaxID=870435 RepID=A0A0C3JQV7_PISTI|nr:xylose isomerase-like protein [Pisolithus tinctorius]KIN99856.1 hypothetical protein M404DRAFT_30120 [Pisolithus tinctorius Marx 270]
MESRCTRSAAGSVENAILNAARVGYVPSPQFIRYTVFFAFTFMPVTMPSANAFALFVKSQCKWAAPPLTESNMSAFTARMTEFEYSPAHLLGKLTTHVGSEKRKKFYECFLDEIQRCEQLGFELYNFQQVQFLVSYSPIPSRTCVPAQIQAGPGNTTDSKLSELCGIIDRVENNDQAGACLDTCHIYAAVRFLDYGDGVRVAPSLTFVLETPMHTTDTTHGAWAAEISVLYRMAGMTETTTVTTNVDSRPPRSRSIITNYTTGKWEYVARSYEFAW